MTTSKSNPIPKKKGGAIKDLDLNKAKAKAAGCDPKGGGSTKLNLDNPSELADGPPRGH
jgi:hypothetical protein